MGGSAWLVWLGVGLAMAAIEVVTVDFVFIMLALGAFAAAVACLCGADFALSAVIAVVVSIALIFTLRPRLREHLRPKRDNSDIGARAIIGRTGYVVEDVSTQGGSVKVQGETWSAQTPLDAELPQGTAVTVQELQGAHLVVVPAAKGWQY